MKVKGWEAMGFIRMGEYGREEERVG